MMEWISVSDALPAGHMRVIAYFPDGDESGRKVSTGCRLGKKVVSDELTSTAAWFHATHWMPFPNPPAGERRD